jgi:hypothetical protein
MIGISRSTTGAVITEVSEAIASLRSRYIFMPRDRDELMNNYEAFYDIGKFSTVVGTIDCTHVKISGQGGNDGEIFRNRKQYFSINVQSVASADLRFQDIVANWPGSTHDSHIFNNSRLKTRFENKEFRNAVLLGDGGYKLQTYLMTPFRNPSTEDEMKYNRTHILVRNTVERKYGVWKRRFPCLVFGLRCEMKTLLTVITACSVLHNICIETADTMPELSDEEQRSLEEAIKAADVGSERIGSSTSNSNRAAVLKRESFVQQIAQVP